MNVRAAFSHNHGFNRITSFLHGFRFKKTLHYLKKLQKEIPDRPLIFMDIGCGKGELYEVIKGEFPDIRYIGIEIQDKHALVGIERYQDNPNVTILNNDATKPGLLEAHQPDIVVALETLEHIPTNVVQRLIEAVANIPSLRIFLASVPIEVGPSLWVKNIGSALMGYHRHKEYTWRETLLAGLCQLDKIPRHDCRHKGYDWRWTAQTLRINMTMIRRHTSPFDWIPIWLSPSIMFVAKPDEKEEEVLANAA